jgi:hypothetical protein
MKSILIVLTTLMVSLSSISQDQTEMSPLIDYNKEVQSDNTKLRYQVYSLKQDKKTLNKKLDSLQFSLSIQEFIGVINKNIIDSRKSRSEYDENRIALLEASVLESEIEIKTLAGSLKLYSGFVFLGIIIILSAIILYFLKIDTF